MSGYRHAMRRFGIVVLGSIGVLAAALVADSLSDTAASGWLALIAVGLAVTAVLISGVAWISARPTAVSETHVRRLARLSVAVVVLAAFAAGALVLQAALASAVIGWIALIAVPLLAVASVAAWAFDVTG